MRKHERVSPYIMVDDCDLIDIHEMLDGGNVVKEMKPEESEKPKTLNIPSVLKSKEVNPEEAQEAYKKQKENLDLIHKTFMESRLTMREGIIRTLERKMSP